MPISASGNLFPTLAIKAPCLVATTGTNITLLGVQTIDGVSVGGSGEFVLVKDNVDQRTNGIYEASTGNWIRRTDSADNTDFIAGTLVFVSAGTANAGTLWQLTTRDNPVVIGNSRLTWVPVNAFVPTGAPATGRTRLLTAANFYVATTGSDSTGDGTAGKPWATRNFAYNFIQNNYDTAGNSVTINIAAGSYTDGCTVNGKLFGQTALGQVIFNGAGPSTIIIPSGSGFGFACENGAQIKVQNLTLDDSGSNFWAINAATLYSEMWFSNITYNIGDQTICINPSVLSRVVLDGAHNIHTSRAGTPLSFLQGDRYGIAITLGTVTINYVDPTPPSWSLGFVETDGGTFFLAGLNFTKVGNGVPFFAFEGGSIQTSFAPGFGATQDPLYLNGGGVGGTGGGVVGGAIVSLTTTSGSTVATVGASDYTALSNINTHPGLLIAASSLQTGTTVVSLTGGNTVNLTYPATASGPVVARAGGFLQSGAIYLGSSGITRIPT
jgi:hypothetical protein